ncbi:MAG: fatty acid desaturase [Candidatus Dadabacteria bacterium]|nr:MAG: fatty acid desaturase [Candidatus Dadabacteria bacterium]
MRECVCYLKKTLCPNYMSLEILRDKKIRELEVNDLVHLTPFESFIEVFLPVPWLVTSLLLFPDRWYLAVIFSFFFFLAGLRVVHGAFHNSLGLSKSLDHIVMVILSAIMLSSMHSVKVNHLLHHKHCMNEKDIEGKPAQMSALQAIFYGPIFFLSLHYNGWALSTKSNRYWILTDWAAIVCLILFALKEPYQNLTYHYLAMSVGQCLTAFFAVWTVHHDCEKSWFIARTIRNKIKSFITMGMFYHIEHHLYPKVPTKKLPAAAERLDKIAPELSKKKVF